MRIEVGIYYNGFALALSGLAMILSALVGLFYNDGSALLLAVSGLLTAGFGLFPMVFIPRRTDVSLRESIFVVAFGWITCTIAGAIPFYLYGAPFTLIDAMFKSISGFTTTGASILPAPEDLPKGLLFWRVLTHGLGGVGIVAFALLVLPRIGQVNRSLLQQEFSGLGAPPPIARAMDIVRGLFAVYIGLMIAETALLMLTGMNWFDAVTNSISTVATGGFSVRNSSVAYYDSALVDTIIMVFMLLGGMNFIFLLGLLRKPGSTKYGWEVSGYFLGFALLLSAFTVYQVYGSVYQNFGDAVRYGTFQLLTVGTSTGFGTADSSVWPTSAQVAITIATILGGCAGSTAGGIKADRLLLFFKALKFRLVSAIHPNLVSSIRVDGRYVSLENVDRATFYITAYLAVLGVATLLLTWTGMTSVDAFTGSVACMANAGPGMGSIGTMENFGHLPNAGKGILMIVMLLGRLEIYALLLPFTPRFWKV